MRIYFRYFARQLSVMAMLALAACGNPEHMTAYPNPVMPKEPAMLAQIITNTGVQVAPLDGFTAEAGRPILEAVSEALREMDIPAVADQPLAGAHKLQGKALPSTTALQIDWTLNSPDGKQLMVFTEREAARSASAIKALAERTALAIVPYFNTAGGNALDATTVIVSDISGAPGDGDVVLPQALRRALNGAGLSVIETDDPKAVQIEGRVQVSDLNSASQLLKLSWRVLAPGGVEIGVIDQENQVAPGQIDTHWGEIAYLAADGAKDGIIDLLSEYRAHANPSPPPRPLGQP